MILATLLGSDEFAAGTHRPEWRAEGGWNQAFIEDRIIKVRRFHRRWGVGITGFLIEDFRAQARLVPLIEINTDPYTRGEELG